MFDITPWIAVVTSVSSAGLAGGGSWLVARTKASSDLAAALAAGEAQADAVRAEHAGPNWDSYVSRLEAHFDKRLAEQDEKIKKQDTKIGSLTSMLDELREHARAEKARYSAALRHIFAWRELHPESLHKVAVPAEIADDLRDRL